MLKGTVPNFSTKDITLAFTIDGKIQNNNTSFPNKKDGYIVEQVDCDDNVTAKWNNSKWSLEEIKNSDNASKIKCTIKFISINEESELNGAEPVLKEGMIPVTIGEGGIVTKINEKDKNWYNYKEKNWANAIILVEGKTSENYEEGAQIPEEDIESYFVWIPKYSYKLFDNQLGKYESTTKVNSDKQNQAIDIHFGIVNTDDSINGECTTPMNKEGNQGLSGESGKCEVGDYMTHPAFLAFNTTGLWIGKFETGNKNITSTNDATQHNNDTETEQLIIKPNQYSWRGISVGNAFKTSLAYEEKLQSHMMKNTEWGAVAYLTQSVFGRCETENNCTEITINNNSNYITGFAGKDISSSEAKAEREKDTTSTFNYKNSLSVKASTTGNYTGIYDMSGGAWEYMASVMYQSESNELSYGSSILTENDLKDKRYFDVYNYGTSVTRFDRRILGDATGEIGPFGKSNEEYFSSMNGDLGHFIYNDYPWFVRSRHYGGGKRSGVFAFTRDTGAAISSDSFRIVLAVK